MMRFTDVENGELLCIMLNYGNHPETLGSKNTMITRANISIRNSGHNRKNSSSGKRTNTAPTGPQMVTTPPNIDQMTT